MILFYYGPDDFSIKEHVTSLKASLGDPDMLALNTSVLEGSHLSVEELSSACNSVPFLTDKRLVVVEGLGARFDRMGSEPAAGDGESQSSPELAGSFAESLKKMPETTVLVLLDRELKPSNPLLKALSGLAEQRKFSPPGGGDLVHWINQRVADCGGKMASGAATLLAECVGQDLWTMSAEIEKLLAYCKGREITEADVRLLVASSKETSIFAVVDAIVNRNLSLAVRHLHSLLAEGAAPQLILFMITRQFRLVLQAKELSLQRMSPPEIQSRLGLRSNFAFRKTIQQSRRYSVSQLERSYELLLQTDWASKTGKVEPALGLDLLVADLCGAVT